MLDTCVAQLRLLETTDLHMQLTGRDYVLGRHEDEGGLERLSGSIAALRNDGIETILCDNGDFLEGSPLADTAMDLVDMGKHPLVCAMNALRYDAIALGNHEFDYGSERLRAVIEALDAPVICANVRVSQRQHFTTPWTIVTRQLRCSDGVTRPINVGLIGFVTPLQVHWGQRQKEAPLITDDILAAAMTHLPALRRAGADIAVAMAHTGIGPAVHSYGMENAALPLASLRGLDAVMLGHTHDQFPSEKFKDHPNIDVQNGLIQGTPTVMAGQLAEALGQIDLTLEFAEDDWHIKDQSVRLIDAATVNTPPDPEFKKTLSESLIPVQAKTIRKMEMPLGSTPNEVNTYFSAIGFDPTLKLISQSQMNGVREGLKGTPYEGLPMLGAAASFRSGGRQGPQNYLCIDQGDVTARHVAAMTPFDNPVCAVLRRGWQIRSWLEGMSNFFVALSDEFGLGELLNNDFPTYHFDAIYGLDYGFDLSKPHSPEEAYSRVSHLKFAGETILDDDLFVVATSRYRALGGGSMGNVPQEDIVFQTDDGVRSLIGQTLARGHLWENSPNWSFKAPKGSSAMFKSSPQALRCPPESWIQATETEMDGFATFRLIF